MEDNKEQENKEQGKQENHGNTRLPFGLCKRYGIDLPEDATPRYAWNALAGKGITPNSVFESLQRKNKEVNEGSKTNIEGLKANGQETETQKYKRDFERIVRSRKFDVKESGGYTDRERVLISVSNLETEGNASEQIGIAPPLKNKKKSVDYYRRISTVSKDAARRYQEDAKSFESQKIKDKLEERANWWNKNAEDALKAIDWIERIK